MPFANDGCLVAFLLEKFREGLLVSFEDVVVLQEAIDVRHANTPVLKVKTLKGEVSKEALARITVTQSKEPEQAAEDKTEEETEPESNEPKSDEPEKSDDK